ncbi:DNA/RNA polymerases superfamily protein [Gossypium australe]|uniref:DNA/RNA polymerases superfamily protein n=1 Tax=Gossypium australe TaxID=47621 RepID=A0A5B6V9T4_9ROSI|nr:DNA/RNA polymerases superfamily protein [Gossypium australe]
MVANRAVADDVESNAPASVHRVAQSDSIPVSTTQQPPPPPNPQPIPVAPQGVELLRLNTPPIDKIQKHGVEEFRANVDDDPEVFGELSYTSVECLKCVVSLLRDTAYQWWNTLVSVVPRERVTWEFFQAEFKKKFISQRFIDQKRKEFLELK